MRVRSIAANIAHDAELAVRRLEALDVDERRDRLGQVDTVDEYIGIDNLRVWAIAVFGLWQIPLLDLAAPNLFEEVDGTTPAAAEGTKHQAAGLASCDFLTGSYVLLELGNQFIFIVVKTASVCEGLEAREGLAVGVGELPGPSLTLLDNLQSRWNGTVLP